MKKSHRSWLLALQLMLSVSSANALNLLQDGSFESGNLSQWIQFGNTGYSGVQCSLVPVPAGNCNAFFGPSGSTGGIGQVVSGLTVGQTYVLSFALGADGGTPSSFEVFFNGSILLTRLNPPPRPFTYFDLIVTASAPTESASFEFQNDPGYFFFDDVSLMPCTTVNCQIAHAPPPSDLVALAALLGPKIVPEPTTLALLFIAMAGAVGVQRRAHDGNRHAIAILRGGASVEPPQCRT